MAFDMYEMIHEGLAEHRDLGVIELTRDGNDVECYREVFTFKGKSHEIILPRGMIDQCSNPQYTRSLIAEVIITDLTGLTSPKMEALKRLYYEEPPVASKNRYNPNEWLVKEKKQDADDTQLSGEPQVNIVNFQKNEAIKW